MLAAKVEKACKRILESYPTLKPKLVIVTNHSNIELQRLAARIGILYEEIPYTPNLIARLNADDTVHGIVIQSFSKPEIIDPKKDVNGLHSNSYFYPCETEAVMDTLSLNNYDLNKKNCLIIGRNTSLLHMLHDEHAIVNQCYSYAPPEQLITLCKAADYIICLDNRPNLILPQYLTHHKSVVIDLYNTISLDAVLLTTSYFPIHSLTLVRLIWHAIQAALDS